ncbi:MAG: hypothetical protein V5A57_02020 [Candidatus Paceibacterota bacterium]
MFHKELLVISLLLVLILSMNLVVRADQCSSSSSRNDQCFSFQGQEKSFRAGVTAARQDLFLDFNLGFWGGPLAFVPDLLSNVCYEGRTSYCLRNRSELPWWRSEQISYESPRYRQNFKRGYWQQTQGGNNKVIAKLVGWGSSLALILTVGAICCGGG